jgi:hypothetical protein
MIKHFFYSIIGLLFSVTVMSQPMVEKEIAVGMKVKIATCKDKGKSIESMDLYRKTRIPETILIDTATGEGIFESFFTQGDFDAKRLPCSYSNKSYIVAALRLFADEKTGIEKRVMILYTNEPYALIWVEFDKAIELKEISF